MILPQMLLSLCIQLISKLGLLIIPQFIKMVLNKKNIMTTILLSGLLVPFILITDIFPFLRFGMFAEPIKKNIQTEKFILYQTNTTGERSIFNPETIGINPNTFYYLCRNYYYRNESNLFADKLFKATGDSVQTLELLKTIATINSKNIDTLKIGIFARHE
jgi:hypothetical protein